MVEKSQDKEMDKSVAVGNVENNSEKYFVPLDGQGISNLFPDVLSYQMGEYLPLLR